MILSVNGISFAYRGVPVLEDVTFTLAEGEMAALLGPNGTGKTTLLRTIGGILRPADGGGLQPHTPAAVEAGGVGRQAAQRRFAAADGEDLDMCSGAGFGPDQSAAGKNGVVVMRGEEYPVHKIFLP